MEWKWSVVDRSGIVQAHIYLGSINIVCHKYTYVYLLAHERMEEPI